MFNKKNFNKMKNLDFFKLTKGQMNKVCGGRTWHCHGSNVDIGPLDPIMFDLDVEADSEDVAMDTALQLANCNDCYVSCY